MKYSIYSAFIIMSILLLLPLVASQSSSTEVSFSLPGCIAPNGEKMARSSCSLKGEYFCNSADHAYSTITGANAGTACRGTYGTPGGSFCCPLGKQCSATGCVIRLNPCDDYTAQGPCESNGCAWIYNGKANVCRDRNSISCSDYRTQASCSSDSMYLGKNGLGSSLCRTNAYVQGKMVSNCSCVWDSTLDKCKLVYQIEESTFVGTPLGFSCEKIFQVADCIGGQQKVNWTASVINNENYTASSIETNESACIDGTTTLACGESIIKLPFFSMINIISAILIIAFVYLILLRK